MTNEYYFTVEAKGADIKQSSSLPIRKKGIYLHFLRFGFLLQNNAQGQGEKEYQEATVYEPATPQTIEFDGEKAYLIDGVEALQVEGLSGFEHFDLVRTGLNEGYLYLINDNPNATDAFREVEVDSLGKLRYLIEEGHKDEAYEDVRVFTNNTPASDYLIVEEGTKYWIAYSHVQWHYKYLKEMLTDERKRKKRMQLIECKGIEAEKDDLANEVKSFRYIKAAFAMGDRRLYHYQNALEQIVEDEKRQKEANAPEVYEDLFITLNDPMGCAFDMGIKLRELHTLHQATITSLQTGEDYFAIFKRMWDETGEAPNPPKNSKDYQSLFGTALSLYHLLYSQATEDMGKGLRGYANKQRITNVLGTGVRGYYHEAIEKVRKDFCTLLSCDYFKKHLKFFTEDLRCVYLGKYFLSNLLTLLQEHAQDKDRYIDLPEDYKGNNEPHIDRFFEEVTKEGSVFDKILSRETPPELFIEHGDFLSFNTTRDLTISVVKVSESVAEAFAKHCHRKASTAVMLKYVLALPYKGRVVYQLKAMEMREFDRKGLYIDDRELVFNKYGKSDKGLMHISTGKSLEESQAIAESKRVELPFTHKTEKFINDIINHPRFRAFMISLDVISLGVSTVKLAKEPSTKNIINAGGAGAQLRYSCLRYQEAKKMAQGFTETQIEKLPKKVKFWGAVSEGIAIVMCTWDAYDAFKARDVDAGFAWGASAALSSISLLYFLGIVELTFWPITAVVALAFGTAALAIYLTDSPLEVFVKHNLLSDEVRFTTEASYELDYTKALIENKNKLVKKDYAQWRNLQTAQDDLYDILLAHRTEVKREEPTPLKEEYRNLSTPQKMFTLGEEIYKIITIRITPAKFINKVSSFNCKMLFFPKGIQKTYTAETEPMDVPISKKDITFEFKEESSAFLMRYNIYDRVDKSIYNSASRFVFISQVEISPAEYWPSQRGQERYQAMIIDAFAYTGATATGMGPTGNQSYQLNTMRAMGDFAHERTIIGTLEEIKNPKNWKK